MASVFLPVAGRLFALPPPTFMKSSPVFLNSLLKYIQLTGILARLLERAYRSKVCNGMLVGRCMSHISIDISDGVFSKPFTILRLFLPSNAAATTGLVWPLLSFPFLTFLLDHSPVYLLGFSPGPLNRFVLLLSWLVVLALADVNEPARNKN